MTSRALNLSALAIVAVAGPCIAAGSPPVAFSACGIAVLRNGFTVSFARKEPAGAATRLWLCGDAVSGYVEIQSEQIESFEKKEEAVKPRTAPPEDGVGVNGAPPLTVADLIAGAAFHHQIDPDFVASVVKAESNFNPAAVSRKGAGGLMQLTPQTAARLGVGDVFDPAANVEGGTKYLRELLDLYGGDAIKALAAYNAGPLPVKQYGGIPPYPETRAYVARVLQDYNRKKSLPQFQPSQAH